MNVKSLKKITRKSSPNPPPEDWTKTNIDASGRLSMRTISIGYIMRNNHGKIIMAREAN